MGNHRTGFLIRETFQMKISLIVGLVAAFPPRSPNITTMNLFFWVKDPVYITPVSDINTLQSQIQDAILAITGEMLANTWSEIE